MEEAAFLRELLDEPVARVAQARFRRDAVLGGGLLDDGAREAGEEVGGGEVRQEIIPADRLAGEPCRDAAVGPILAAGEDLHQHLTGGLLQDLAIIRERAVNKDVPGDFAGAHEAMGAARPSRTD